MGGAEFRHLVKLPKERKGNIPTIQEIEAEFDRSTKLL